MAKLSEKTGSLPFAAVILQRGAHRHSGGRKLAIVIRGTQTADEWAADFRCAAAEEGR